MYRKAGSQSALSGVPSGPFTGGRRLLDSARLEEATRERLARAIGGRGDVSPIAYEHPKSLAVSARASWGVVASTMAIAYVFAVGFGNPDSAWAYQPIAALAIYGAAGLLFAFSLLAALRRRALFGGEALRPGRYLFSLDAVEISLPDASGRQTITVRSLGDARDARIERAARRTELVIFFDDSSQARYPLRGDASGDVALRRLEHAQRLIEELTYSRGLEQAFTNDLFFDLRVDKSWSSAAPDAAAGPPSSARRQGVLVRAVLGRLAPVHALLLAVAIGGGAFEARRVLGDQALFNHALRRETPEAMDVYVARGGRRRREAEAVRDAMLHAREVAAREAKADELREAAARSFGAPVLRAPPATAESCLARLREQRASAHPEVPRIMEAILARADRTGDRVVPLSFRRTIAPPPAPVPELGADLERRERRTAWSFERVFSEVCPASVVRFIAAPAAGGAVSGDGPTLEIAYEISWTDRSFDVKRRDGATVTVHAFQTVFDVRLRGPSAERPATFRLTMPPPLEAPTTTRPRSIFPPLDQAIPDGEAVGWSWPPTPEQRMYSAMTARAFDRLYDELYGLFFDGDPRVPLPPADADRGL